MIKTPPIVYNFGHNVRFQPEAFEIPADESEVLDEASGSLPKLKVGKKVKYACFPVARVVKLARSFDGRMDLRRLMT